VGGGTELPTFYEVFLEKMFRLLFVLLALSHGALAAVVFRWSRDTANMQPLHSSSLSVLSLWCCPLHLFHVLLLPRLPPLIPYVSSLSPVVEAVSPLHPHLPLVPSPHL
jgi:hypothetical protein